MKAKPLNIGCLGVLGVVAVCAFIGYLADSSNPPKPADAPVTQVQTATDEAQEKLLGIYVKASAPYLANCKKNGACIRLQGQFVEDFLIAQSGNVSAMRLLAKHINDPGDAGVKQSPAIACMWQMVANSYPDGEIAQSTIRPDDGGCRIVLSDSIVTALAIQRATEARSVILQHPLRPIPRLLEERAAALAAN